MTDYTDIDAVNWSTLQAIRVSPKHYRHRLVTPRTDSDAMRLGRMVHTGIYEPELMDDYAVMPKFHGGMKESTAIDKGYAGGREAKAQWEEDHEGCEIVSAEVSDSAAEMIGAVRDDDVAGPLVAGGYNEQTITWVDVETGIRCKGRCDEVQTTNGGALVELKTSRFISPRKYESEAISRGYLSQVAFYLDGLRANGLVISEVRMVVVQNEAPWDVVVYDIGEDALAFGRSVYLTCLCHLSSCRQLGVWPGAGGGGVRGFELPAWAATTPSQSLTMGGAVMEV